jgi:hypothetical protein
VFLEELARAGRVVGEQHRGAGGGESVGLAYAARHGGEQRKMRGVRKPDRGVGLDLQFLGNGLGHVHHVATDKKSRQAIDEEMTGCPRPAG